MCKFSGKDDPEYQKVKNVLARYVQELLEFSEPEKSTVYQKPNQSRNKYYCVPHNVSDHFTGRRAVLSMIDKAFLSPLPEITSSHQKKFALYGLGGSGKTQIALKFAQEARKRLLLLLSSLLAPK
jgi:signal recognition particle GTPase